MGKKDTLPNLDAALRHMAPIISHEIRNPLAIIGNSSYFIKTKLGKQGDLDPKIKRHLDIIDIELRHANGTLGEILAYARMPEPNAKPLPLNALVEDAFKALPPPDGVTAKKELCSENLRVAMDPALAKNALTHVLRNAFETAAIPLSDGEKAGPIIVRTLKRDGKWGDIEVFDDGPGIVEKVKEKLFTPFNTDKPRGIGLGLAYAHKVLSRLGGNITLLDSKKGAALRLSLPLA